MNKKVKTRKP